MNNSSVEFTLVLLPFNAAHNVHPSLMHINFRVSVACEFLTLCSLISSTNISLILRPRDLGMRPCGLGMWPCDLGMWPRDLGMWPCGLGMWPCDLGMWPCGLGMWPCGLGMRLCTYNNIQMKRTDKVIKLRYLWC